ncbi:MAG: TolC family protein, partial [Clostridia bacterium]|nr:TolC family protein [Clostridia bacterium]
MKKRITALVLAVVLIISMSCVGAFAKDDVTEVSIDNIYKLTYDNNPNIVVLSNNIFILGMAGLTNAELTANASTITSLTVSKKQIAYGAQQLLLSYYKLLNTRDTLKINLAYLDESLNVSKVMYEMGMMTYIDYIAILNSKTELQSNLITLESNISQIETSLKTMINLSSEDQMKIAEFKPLDAGVIDTLDREACYAQAVQNSYTLKSNFETLFDADMNYYVAESDMTEKQRDNAVISYRTAKTAVSNTFDNQWTDLALKRDALKIAQTKVELAKTTYELDQVRMENGTISKIDLVKSENAYKTAQIDYNNAQIDFTTAYKKFEALLAGVEL